MSEVGRIGEIESLILRNLYEIEHEDRGEEVYRIGEKYRRTTYPLWRTPVALLEIRNWIYGGIESIDQSNRASFCRAVRILENKGLIETWGHVGKYRTHAKLTEKGEELVAKVIEPRILKIKKRMEKKLQTLTIGSVPKC